MVSSLSALVLTRNSEQHIGACLETLAWVADVVVVDDGSADRTREIAKALGANVVEHRLDRFDSQRNFGLTCCRGEWVLVVDSDERVTPELRAEVEAALRAPRKYVGFRIPRRNHVMGYWVRWCGWYPDYVIRLFRREGTRYVGAVHERPLPAGAVGTLRRPLSHFTYHSLEQYAAKMDRYSTTAAAERWNNGRRARLSDLLVRPGLIFLKQYLLRLGVLDGVPGLVVSMMSAYYTFLKYAKLHYLGLVAASGAPIGDDTGGSTSAPGSKSTPTK